MTIKVYQGTIKTIGPVHIGNGTTLKKQDYIYDFHNAKVHMVNGAKLVKYLKSKGLLDSYQTFLKSPPKNPKENGLINYLEAQHIKQHDWRHFINYSEHVNQGKKNVNVRPKPLNDLHVMVRDGRGEVYIPGSSIKGALKTAIVSKYQNERDTYFYSKIKVSDSRPIEDSCLAIYEKIDINKNSKPMPLYRECIDVDTIIHFTLEIEDDVITIEELESCIQSFYKNYYNKWLVGFKDTRGGQDFDSRDGIPDVNDQNVLYLGAGAGFVSKTLHYQIKDRTQARKDTFNELKRKFRKTYGKMTQIPENVPIALKGTHNHSKDKDYQQGMCEISFES